MLPYGHRMHLRGEDTPLPRRAPLVGGIIAALVLLATVALWLWWPGPTKDSAASPGSDATSTAISPSPLFASDEETLAVATAAYANYLDVSDAIARDGGADSNRMSTVVSSEYLPASVEGFDWFVDRAAHLVGQTTFDTVSLQAVARRGDGISVATLYLCGDVSGARLIDQDGTDVTPSDRPERLPLQVDIEIDRGTPEASVVGRSTVWTGETFCS
jgi:hypothetical protein